MKKNIEIGVVGCGYWGPNLVRNLRQAQDCQLKVLCDVSEQRLNHLGRLYPEVSTTRRFEDLLTNPELDAIVIATPVRFHFEMEAHRRRDDDRIQFGVGQQIFKAARGRDFRVESSQVV